MKKVTIESHWWFYPFLILISLFLPPFVEHYPDSPASASRIVFSALSSPAYNNFKWLFPISKIMLIVIIILCFYRPRSSGKFLAFYGFSSMLFIGVFQNLSNTDEFGFIWLISNTFLMFLVAMHWIEELKFPKLNLNYILKSHLRHLIIPLMFLPIILPVSFFEGTLIWDFSLKNILLNESCVTYCMVTPSLIGLQILCYPKINYYLLKISAFIGFIFSVYNMAAWFFIQPSMWIMGIMHLPLLITSLIGMYLTFFKPQKEMP